MEIGSTFRPNFLATYFSTFGLMLANVPTAPEIAHVETSSMASLSLMMPLMKFLHVQFQVQLVHLLTLIQTLKNMLPKN